MLLTRSGLMVVACAMLAACSDDSSGSSSGGSTSSGGGTSSGGTSSGGTSSGGTSSGDAGGSKTPAELCASPPTNSAPQINDQYSTAAMPASGTATGGTIASGTYFMTAITNYESTKTGGTHKDTLVIDTAASTFVTVEVNGGTPKPTVAGTIALSGHTLTETLTCPSQVTATVEYTYAAGTLTFYEYNSKSVSVWTKQ